MNSWALASLAAWMISSSARAAAAVGDVFGDGAVEQESVLLDDAQQPAIAVGGDVAQIDAIEQNRAGGRIVEAGDEIAERRLAGAAGADQGDHLAGLDVQIDLMQHRRGRSGIGE